MKKKHLILIAFIAIGNSSFAQWATSGTQTTTTNTVGIGTTTPSAMLHVVGDLVTNLNLIGSNDFGGTQDGVNQRFTHFSATSASDGSLGTATVVSDFAFAATAWKVILQGGFENNYEGTSLLQLPSYIELNNTNNTIEVGSVTFTFTKNGSNQLQVQASTIPSVAPRGAMFKGLLTIIPNMAGNVAGPASAMFAGNVGIGIINPGAGLNIISGATGNYGIGTPDIGIGNSTTTNATGLQVYRSASSNGYIGLDAFLANVGAAPLVLNEADGGNVGIGTSSPQSTLQVDDGCTKASIGNASGAALNYGTSYLGFNASRTSGGWVLNTDSVTAGHNGGGVIYSGIGGDMYFAPVGSTSSSNQTLADTAIVHRIALHIAPNGITYAKQVNVQPSIFPDYVIRRII